MRRIVYKFEHTSLNSGTHTALHELTTQLEGFGYPRHGLGCRLREKLNHGSRADGQLSAVSLEAAGGTSIERPNNLHHFRKIQSFLISISHPRIMTPWLSKGKSCGILVGMASLQHLAVPTDDGPSHVVHVGNGPDVVSLHPRGMGAWN